MADWTLIADSALDPDAPLTSDLAYAWRDNPIAIAEGATDAPKVQGIALGGVYRICFGVCLAVGGNRFGQGENPSY